MIFMYIHVMVDCVADQWEWFKWYVGVCVCVCVCNRSKWVDAFEGLLSLLDMGVSEI